MSDKNRIKKLEQQMEQYQSRISSLEEELEEIKTPSVTRRGVLGALGIAGLGTAGGTALAQRASAQESRGSIGTAENPLGEIYVDDLYQNADHIRSDTVGAENAIYNAVYNSIGDISSDLEEEGVQAYTQSDGPVVYEGAGWQSIADGNVKISEAGVIDHGTVSANSTSYVDISFDESYDAPPVVIQEWGTSQVWFGEGMTSGIDGIDTEEFTSVVYNSRDDGISIDHVGYLVIRQ